MITLICQNYQIQKHRYKFYTIYVIEIFQFKMSIFVKPFRNKILEIQDTKGYRFVGVWSEFSTVNILLHAKADPKLMGN